MTTDILEIKYRPKTFDEFISYNDTNMDFINDIISYININPYELPNLLLHGTPGTGKTTLANIIINSLNADYIYLNASDNRGVGDMRVIVREFVATKAMNSKVPKIVFFDEADGLTADAQNLLRGLMENYSSNSIFILTCNNINKIIPPLQSRCKMYHAKTPDIDMILKRLKFICDAEAISYTDDKLKQYIDVYYPDMRKMIQNLRNMDSAENIVNKVNEIYNHIIECRTDKCLKHSLIYDKTLNHRIIMKQLFDKMESSMSYANVKIFAEADYRMSVGSTPEIQFVWLIQELIKR